MKPVEIAKGKIHAARQWVFRWRGLDGTPLRGLLAILITGGAFALFAATVRIRVAAPQQWVERKASVIQLADDAEGRMWALRAREGGPFPSRVDPSQWLENQDFSATLNAATRLKSDVYQPKLRDLPGDDQLPPQNLTMVDPPVFPQRSTARPPAVTASERRLQASIFPLSGLPMESMPRQLPPFEGAIDAAVSSGSWRFLLGLKADGSVTECFAFSEEPGGEAVTRWLRGVNFGPDVARKFPWIGVGVLFTNQAADGPDAR